MGDTPALTCVVIAQQDELTLAHSLAALDREAQRVDGEVQIVVVVSGSPETAAIARQTMPRAEVVQIDQPVFPGEARNAGLARARGTVISFPGSHVVVRPGSLRARLQAHADGHAMATGTLLNGTATWAGWAAYLLESSANLPGLPAGELEFPPAHCSYLRAALESVGGFPPVRSGEDTHVNEELWARGYRAYREPTIEITHYNRCRTARVFARYQVIRGIGWSHLMTRQHADQRLFTRSGLRRWVVDMFPGRLWFVGRNVWHTRDGHLMARFIWTSPLIAVGAAVGWVVAWVAFALAVLSRTKLRQRRLDGNSLAPSDLLSFARKVRLLSNAVEHNHVAGARDSRGPQDRVAAVEHDLEIDAVPSARSLETNPQL